MWYNSLLQRLSKQPVDEIDQKITGENAEKKKVEKYKKKTAKTWKMTKKDTRAIAEKNKSQKEFLTKRKANNIPEPEVEDPEEDNEIEKTGRGSRCEEGEKARHSKKENS